MKASSRHIREVLVFELSKVALITHHDDEHEQHYYRTGIDEQRGKNDCCQHQGRQELRDQMLCQLLLIDEQLAEQAMEKLPLQGMESPAAAAISTRKDLRKSDKLSIQKNNREFFKGRKIGVFMIKEAEGDLFSAFRETAEKAGAVIEVVAPGIGWMRYSNGQLIKAEQ